MADTYDLTEVVHELRIANTKRTELNATAAGVLAALLHIGAEQSRIAAAQERIATAQERIAAAQERLADAHERVANAQERIATAQEILANCCRYGSLRSEAMLMVSLQNHDAAPNVRWDMYESLVGDLAPLYPPPYPVPGVPPAPAPGLGGG